VAQTLTRIAYIFADVRQLDNLYGMTVVRNSDAVSSKQETVRKSRMRRILPGTSSMKDIKDTSAMADLCTELNLGEDYVATLSVATEFNRIVSLALSAKFKWVFSDKEKLYVLVQKLRRHNKDLTCLTGDFMSVALSGVSHYILSSL
jgi:hypothetical protein